MTKTVQVNDEPTPAQLRLASLTGLPENEVFSFTVPRGEGSRAVAQIRTEMWRIRQKAKRIGRTLVSFKLYSRVEPDKADPELDRVSIWRGQSAGTQIKNGVAQIMDQIGFPDVPNDGNEVTPTVKKEGDAA